MQAAEFEAKVRFLSELAKRLHQYGTSAPRLESAIDSVSTRLGLSCNSLSTPTSIILSIGSLEDGPDALPRFTQVLRVEPGEVNLRRLSETDDIAERVFHGQLDVAQGLKLLQNLRSGLSRKAEVLQVLCFAIASTTVSVLLGGAMGDVLTATCFGLIIGLLGTLAGRIESFAASFELVAAFIATFGASLVAAHWAAINVRSVVIAALIVLLPGLMLTTAVVELSSRHLVAGSVRLMGASAILLKLAVGAAAGFQLAKTLQLGESTTLTAALPGYASWLALLAGTYSFAILFQAAKRDIPLAMASAWLGYLCTTYAGQAYGQEFGVFFAGLVVACASNLFARLRNRPGAIVRVPGIILLVPGSVGFRSLFFVFERDVYLGLDMAFSLVVLLASLVAGLLLGNVLLPPRRSL